MVSAAVTKAAKAFEAELEEFGFDDPEAALGDPIELGRRAALLVAAEAAWREHLGLLFETSQVQLLLQVGTRQAVNDLVKRRRLLGLPAQQRRLLFPAFQFMGSGRPHPALPEILGIFDGAVVSSYTIASWFATPQAVLESKTPAEWLQLGLDPALVKEAARRSAARLGH